MDEDHKFYQNKKCKYFPCHDNINKDKFNCMFCYCPLYPYNDCGGNYEILEGGWKDCSDCIIPHRGKKSYNYIVKKLKEKQPNEQ